MVLVSSLIHIPELQHFYEFPFMQVFYGDLTLSLITIFEGLSVITSFFIYGVIL